MGWAEADQLRKDGGVALLIVDHFQLHLDQVQLELREGQGVIHHRNPLGRRSTYPGRGHGEFCRG